jgi:hypothetical protein
MQMYIYVDVDSEGYVVKGIGGTNPVPDAEYDFFFIRDKITADNLTKFRVVISNFSPDLVLRDGEVIEEATNTPEGPIV